VEYFYDGLVPGGAYDNLEPDCSTSRPVVVFSHGDMGVRWQSPFLMEHLASRGYLGLAVDHTHNTFMDYDPTRQSEILIRRPQDVVDTYEWFAAESENAESPFHGCVDRAEGFAVMGHSFGAMTSLIIGGTTIDMGAVQEVCDTGDASACALADAWFPDHPGEDIADLSDPRVTAIVPISPADGGLLTAGLPNVAVPTAIIGGTLDTYTPWETDAVPIFNNLTAVPRYLAGIEDAAHGSFLGMCDLYSAVEGCGPGFRDLDEVHTLTKHVAAALLDISRGIDEAKQYLPPDAPGFIWDSVE
jgi:predicted dienelactone hydrolase